jgi:hypothetical protein
MANLEHDPFVQHVAESDADPDFTLEPRDVGTQGKRSEFRGGAQTERSTPLPLDNLKESP